MPTAKKIETVGELKERLSRATLLIGAQYRGLTVKEMDQLRRRFRAGGVEVRVVKNTLLRLAAQEAGRPEIMRIVEGPTAIAFVYGDVVEAARAVTEYAQTAPPAFIIKGGLLDSQVVSQADLRDLVRLPSRPVLLAEVLGQIQSPLAGLMGLLEGPLREFAGLMQSARSEFPGLVEARIKQLEEQPQ